MIGRPTLVVVPDEPTLVSLEWDQTPCCPVDLWATGFLYHGETTAGPRLTLGGRVECWPAEQQVTLTEVRPTWRPHDPPLQDDLVPA